MAVELMYPSKCIIANLSFELIDNRVVGRSLTGLRDRLRCLGYPVEKIMQKWVAGPNGPIFTGSAVVFFESGYENFIFAYKLLRVFEDFGKGKAEMVMQHDPYSGPHCGVASWMDEHYMSKATDYRMVPLTVRGEGAYEEDREKICHYEICVEALYQIYPHFYPF